MAKVGERLSILAFAVLLIAAYVVAFIALGYLVGKLLL